LPASLKTLGSGAFYACTTLETVTFAEGFNPTMWDSAFWGTGVTSFAFPASLESIGQNTFSVCSALETITFAEGSVLGTIGSSAFSQTGVTSLDLPARLKTIEYRAFSYCYNLTIVTFDGSTCYADDVTISVDAFLYSPADPQPCARR
jgi:hypothetical protein